MQLNYSSAAAAIAQSNQQPFPSPITWLDGKKKKKAVHFCIFFFHFLIDCHPLLNIEPRPAFPNFNEATTRSIRQN